MPIPSNIDKLPEEVREALDEWLRDPYITQAEATQRTNAMLEEMGLPQRISSWSVSRYDRRMHKVSRKVTQSRQIAEAWIAKLGSVPGGKLGHLVTEMLRTLAFDLTHRLQEDDLDDKSLPGVIAAATRLSLMAERLERASEINDRRERQLKRDAAEELAAKAATEAKKSGRDVSPERLREIFREMYGVG